MIPDRSKRWKKRQEQREGYMCKLKGKYYIKQVIIYCGFFLSIFLLYISLFLSTVKHYISHFMLKLFSITTALSTFLSEAFIKVYNKAVQHQCLLVKTNGWLNRAKGNYLGIPWYWGKSTKKQWTSKRGDDSEQLSLKIVSLGFSK